ncbi:endolytic transglycosylase MltG [Candidatus Gracilibacteria bacterium]|nr:endolytic transglycosylase MltG [Candidatus Gracilibacteria bacterium]NUJ99368.1 endolytic transglycosylase MltG [Candidatus Gracilibacteria bacterium]
MKKFIKLVIIFFIIFGVGFFVMYNNFSKSIVVKEQKIIEIKEGDNFYSLSNMLKIDKNLFKIYLKFNPPSFDLQKGKYVIKEKSSLGNVIKQLQNPINEDIQITFLEGWNVYDIDEKLSQMGLIKKEEFIEKVTHNFKNFQQDFAFLEKIETLEGFLYPDTYNINPSSFTLDGLIYKMLKNFQDKVISKGEKKYSSKELLEIIILSSIVEKEEKNPSEKATVSGILKKRLDEGWMLGADATVCYPHKLTSEECKMVVSKYIGEKNDYNTRTMVGLPITPISNPSAETIFATMNSKSSPYYFYLHGSDGTIHYAVDNAGHEANKSKYLK